MNRITNAVFRTLLRIVCKLDTRELKAQVPMTGPMIIVTNHIGVLEGPILYLFLRPRDTIALAKQELWGHWFTRKIMSWWEAIPVNRDGMDREAMNACFRTLDESKMLCIAPEGTRSKDGRLQEGKAGTGFIAFKKQVTILPVANYGIEQLGENLRRFRRTPVIFKVGTPFSIISDKRRLSPEERQQITDEMMIRIARLMPEQYHGFYADRIDEQFIFTADTEL
jgi:1-acyl-sn-glycerol-3-phosphate acyltransferase